MKKIIFIACFGIGLLGCSEASLVATQTLIHNEFNLPTTTNPTIVNVDKTNLCPKLEFDSANSTTFQVRIAPGSPIVSETTFPYSKTNFHQDGKSKILDGTSTSGSTLELKYDGTSIYIITVSYQCPVAGDPNCSTATYNCSGPLQ